MDSKFAFNKLMFVEMERRNILLSQRTCSSAAEEANQQQLNCSHFLARFLSSKHSPQKTKAQVSKCLFGRPEAGDTKRLEEQMFRRERMRGLNLYQFDIATNQAVNLTPPASPYIGQKGHTASDRVQEVTRNILERVGGGENQTETVIREQKERPSERKSLKRRSSDGDEDKEQQQQRSHSLDDESNGKNLWKEKERKLKSRQNAPTDHLVLEI